MDKFFEKYAKDNVCTFTIKDHRYQKSTIKEYMQVVYDSVMESKKTSNISLNKCEYTTSQRLR